MGKPKHTLEFTYAVMMWLYYDSQGPVEIVDTGLKSWHFVFDTAIVSAESICHPFTISCFV